MISETEINLNSNKAALQMEIIEYQEDLNLMDKFNKFRILYSTNSFGLKMFVQISRFKKLSYKTTYNGLTYVRKAASSKINFI